MKIVHLSWSFTIGGAESLIVDLANEQAKKHTVALVVVNALLTAGLVDRLSKKVRVVTIKRRPGSRKFVDFIRLYAALGRFRPDIIHCHNWTLASALRFYPCTKVLTVHGFNRPFEQQTMRRYKRVFAISGAVAVDIMEKCPDIRPVVVYNGVPLDEVVPREDYRYDDFRLIHVGRLLHEVKGQDILLRALRLLIRDHGFDNLRVDFVGAGPSLQYLKNLAVELGLDKHCSFLGEHPREFIYENLKNYHALVQPSLSEGFGLTIVEAMAAKIPVVISDLDAPMELIRSGEYGRFFKRGHVAACAQRILETMRTYGQEEEKNRLELARKWAVEQFEVKTTATNYLRQYADIVPAKLQRTG